MTISEKIFKILNEIHMSQAEFSRRTGIPTQTINDWKRIGNIPSADKIMKICGALGVTPEELLSEEEPEPQFVDDVEIRHGDRQILIDYHSFNANQQKRLLSYMKRIKKGTDDGKRK